MFKELGVFSKNIENNFYDASKDLLFEDVSSDADWFVVAYRGRVVSVFDELSCLEQEGAVIACFGELNLKEQLDSSLNNYHFEWDGEKIIQGCEIEKPKDCSCISLEMFEDLQNKIKVTEDANVELKSHMERLFAGARENNKEIVELVKAVFNVLSMQVIHGAQSWEAIPENCLSPQQLKLLKAMGLLENPDEEN